MDGWKIRSLNLCWEHRWKKKLNHFTWGTTQHVWSSSQVYQVLLPPVKNKCAQYVHFMNGKNISRYHQWITGVSLLLYQHVHACCRSVVGSSTMFSVGFITIWTTEKTRSRTWCLWMSMRESLSPIWEIIEAMFGVIIYCHADNIIDNPFDPQPVQSITTVQFCVCFEKGWQSKENRNVAWKLKIYSTLFLCTWNEWFCSDVHFKKRISKGKEAGASLFNGLCSTARSTIVPPLVCHLNRASVKLEQPYLSCDG